MEESVSESGSSEEEEEEEDLISLSSHDEEYQGLDTPSDPVDKSETPLFHINWPTIRSMPGGPTAHPKSNETRKKLAGETRKRLRG